MGYTAHEKNNFETGHEDALKDPLNEKNIPVLFSKLTPQEKNVLRILVTGKTSKEIAANLKISVETVQTHRQKILKKLGLDKETKLAVFYERLTKLNPMPDNNESADETP